MRNDLPSMGVGRAAAQASHASNAFIQKYGYYARNSRNLPKVLAWQRQTKQGFGTAIVLSVNETQLFNTVSKAKRLTGIADKITDPDYCIKVNYEVAGLLQQNYDARYCSYTFNYLADETHSSVIISRPVITCGYVFGDKEELQPILGELPLYG